MDWRNTQHDPYANKRKAKTLSVAESIRLQNQNLRPRKSKATCLHLWRRGAAAKKTPFRSCSKPQLLAAANLTTAKLRFSSVKPISFPRPHPSAAASPSAAQNDNHLHCISGDKKMVINNSCVINKSCVKGEVGAKVQGRIGGNSQQLQSLCRQDGGFALKGSHCQEENARARGCCQAGGKVDVKSQKQPDFGDGNEPGSVVKGGSQLEGVRPGSFISNAATCQHMLTSRRRVVVPQVRADTAGRNLTQAPCAKVEREGGGTVCVKTPDGLQLLRVCPSSHAPDERNCPRKRVIDCANGPAGILCGELCEEMTNDTPDTVQLKRSRQDSHNVKLNLKKRQTVYLPDEESHKLLQEQTCHPKKLQSMHSSPDRSGNSATGEVQFAVNDNNSHDPISVKQTEVKQSVAKSGSRREEQSCVVVCAESLAKLTHQETADVTSSSTRSGVMRRTDPGSRSTGAIRSIIWPGFTWKQLKEFFPCAYCRIERDEWMEDVIEENRLRMEAEKACLSCHELWRMVRNGHTVVRMLNERNIWLRHGVGRKKGIGIGSKFCNRQELCAAGLHHNHEAGICTKEVLAGYKTFTAAVSIVYARTRKYADDQNDGGDIIKYEGEREDKREFSVIRQMKSVANQAMAMSQVYDIPVRVISKEKDGNMYTYDGLYKVFDHYEHRGERGTTLMFELRRVRNKKDLKPFESY
ncbi:hypothetical protein CBR_g3069 [Chara braunii]|uniref:YDG domain-containing protein n=1 Tax=Chara braunii TaxID=69332 RepID=A0A388KEN5_CHABU|nr:hypothetical protein CBR_g3069 [Chara braunii]|eukprot:GBG68525.1 hypothetical protein CBR_g3069 [Chara braunii]